MVGGATCSMVAVSTVVRPFTYTTLSSWAGPSLLGGPSFAYRQCFVHEVGQRRIRFAFAVVVSLYPPLKATQSFTQSISIKNKFISVLLILFMWCLCNTVPGRQWTCCQPGFEWSRRRFSFRSTTIIRIKKKITQWYKNLRFGVGYRGIFGFIIFIIIVVVNIIIFIISFFRRLLSIGLHVLLVGF